MTPYVRRRSREYLYEPEVVRLTEAARVVGRHGHRDATLIWLMYRHGLRVSEARALTWGQIDLIRCRIHVRRAKNSRDSIQRLGAYEVGALMRLRPERAAAASPVFASERRQALGPSAIYKLIARAGRLAGLDLPVHPHMLRHACGFHLTNVRKVDARRIQDYLGHRDITHTVRYTELDDRKFDDLWGEDEPLRL